MKQHLNTWIALSIMLLGAIYVYFTFQEKARISKAEIEAAKVKEQRLYEEKLAEEREIKLFECFKQADTFYTQNWANECATLDMSAKCSLPIVKANVIDQTRKETKDLCLKIYQ